MTAPTDVPGVTTAAQLLVDPAAERRWPTVAEKIHAARQARDEGMAQAEDATGAAWDRAVIDQAIDTFAATGEPFSANDLRELLPDVRGPLVGVGFRTASVQQRIWEVGLTTSTKRNTHAKRVAVWVGAHMIERNESS